MKTNTKTKLGSSILPTTLFLIALASIASMYIETSPAHAESSSAYANASVAVSDIIRLALTGGDLVINNLTPGTSADSNIITATVTSNSPYGLHLSATTGTKNGTTSLVNTADSNFSFTNLNANKATLNDFSDNTWGYSYSTNNGTSWVSGDYGITQSGYNGLSLDNDDSGATGTTLFNSDTYTNSTSVKFKIGAKSSSTQASGTYTGTVNFYAVANPGTAQCNNSALCISFDGNGLTFNGETTNNVSYISAPIVDRQIKYSRSVYTEEGNYNGNAALGGNDVVTIKGATSLHIKVTYGVPQGASSGPPSYLYIWEGNHPDYTTSNSNMALSQCGDISADFYSTGSPGSQQTMECDIPGDSVTFYDYSVHNFSTGYYAIVSASVDTFSRQNISGAYAIPEGTNAVFYGWSTTRTTPGQGTPNDVAYRDEADVLANLQGDNAESKTLYAVWKSSKNFANSSTLQEINDCPASLPTERVYTLTDTRDGQDYKVAKLKDGKCWMVENLNLVGGTALTSADTDISDEYINNYTNDNNLTKVDNSLVLPASSNISGDSYDKPYNYALLYNSNNRTTCTDGTNTIPCYSYYSWGAATLASGKDLTGEDVHAPYSICPKGWRLPKTGSQGSGYIGKDLQVLASAYDKSGTNHSSYPYFYDNAGPGTVANFQLAGRYYNNGIDSYYNNKGVYWSSTNYGTSMARFLYVGSGNSTDVARSNSKQFALSVRCLVAE